MKNINQLREFNASESAPPPHLKRAFTTIEAAEYCGMKERTLRIARTPSSCVTFKSPKYRRMGSRKVIYLREDLDKFLDELEEG